MDRGIVYAGAVPLDTDVLSTQRNALVAIGMLAQGVLGTATAVDGLLCIPTTPGTMLIQVTAGQIFSLSTVDASGYGSLGPDTVHQIVKQGIVLDTVPLTVVAPTTVGFAQNYLVQAGFSEVDDTPVTLPYFNPANPAMAFSGPGGSGTSQFTVRRGKCVVSLKAGAAAAAGTQVTPSADPGFVGLYVVTVAQGATQVTSGNITLLSSAPFIVTKLPQVPPVTQSGIWNWAIDTGTANNLAVTLNPGPLSIGGGFPLRVRVAVANTGATTISVNGSAGIAVVHGDGSALNANDLRAGTVASLVHDGTRFQVLNVAYQTAGAASAGYFSYYAADSSGTANVITAAFTPAITSLFAGLDVYVKLANTITGSAGTTITVNALASKSVVHPDGSALQLGDAVAGEILHLVYDGTVFQTQGLHRRDPAKQFFTAFGSYTPVVPSGCYRAEVWIWGGGGAGGTGGALSAGSGGSAGGHSYGEFDCVPGTTLHVTVGPGGAPSASATVNGGAGGASSITEFAISAGGGAGGLSAPDNTTGAGSPGSPGVGTGGLLNLGGGAGQGTVPLGGGLNMGGAGGACPFGGAGSPNPINGSSPANIPGGGSSGGSNQNAGAGTFIPGSPGGVGLVAIKFKATP